MKLHHLILLILAVSCNSQTDYRKDEILAIGRDYTKQFYTKELKSFHNKFNNKSFTLQNLKDFRIKVDNELGSEVEILDEIIDNKIWKNKKYYGYVRYSKFSKAARPVRTLFAFDKDTVIYRFEITLIPNPVPSKYENYTTKSDIRLPFEGEWYIASGGRSSMYNHHTISADQRFAYDFMIKKNGSYYKNAGYRNEEYYSFNQKIIAPGAGTIVDIVNNIAENRIGYMPPENSGNRVIIDHQNGEYSVLCHFKQGSICVNIGDTVESGQYLGLCGNSGRSFAPHIHYHMQNSPKIFSGEGFPIQFKSYYSDGKYVENGEIKYGKQVKNKD